MAGSIPTEIGQCSQLENLYLDDNHLTGSWDFVIVLIDDKRVYQLMQMRWQVDSDGNWVVHLHFNTNQLTGSCDFVIVLIDGKRVYLLPT